MLSSLNDQVKLTERKVFQQFWKIQNQNVFAMAKHFKENRHEFGEFSW